MPCGTTVDELCGQPEQKYGVRADTSLIVATLQHALADRDRDVDRLERAFHREQPAVLLIALADHHRRVRHSVELFAHLHFDQRTLLFDDDDEIEALGEGAQLGAGERPRTADLEQPDAKIVALHLVNTELVERLADIEITLADRDDTDLRIAPARNDHLVELVRMHEGEHGVPLVVVQARLHLEDAVIETNVQPARRHSEFVITRNDDLRVVERRFDNPGRFHRLMHALERHPRTAEARHRPAVECIVDEFLDARGVQDRDHHVDEVEFGLVRGGGGFGRMVVAHQGEHAAVLGGAGEIRVAKHVSGAVDARPLAVPHAEHAVVLALAPQLSLLRTPDGGRGEVLVQAALEYDVVLIQLGLRPHELLVEPAKRRAAIARDISSGIQACEPVALVLHQAGADQRLIAGDEDTALRQIVFVVEGDVLQRHCAGLRGQCGAAGVPPPSGSRQSKRRVAAIKVS
jgi:hypothetical protein